MTAINGDQLLAEVDSFPLDLKTRLIDKLLSSLSPVDHDAEALWQQEIERRIDEVESGRVELVDGQAVFDRIRERLKK